MGGSMSGSSRTGRRERPMTPKRMIARLIMLASTGRWMLMRGRVMALPAFLVLRSGFGWREFHGRTRPDFLDAFDDDFFPRFQAAHDFHLAGLPQTQLDRLELSHAVRADRENHRAVSVEYLAQRDFGDHNRVLAHLHGEIEISEHARSEERRV